jgi:hypothetical protein
MHDRIWTTMPDPNTPNMQTIALAYRDAIVQHRELKRDGADETTLALAGTIRESCRYLLMWRTREHDPYLVDIVNTMMANRDVIDTLNSEIVERHTQDVEWVEKMVKACEKQDELYRARQS